jgi:hypothetical protein
LPVAGAERLYLLMRAAVKGQAELLAVSYAERMDLTYKSDQEWRRRMCNTSPDGCSARSDCGLPRGGCSRKTTI